MSTKSFKASLFDDDADDDYVMAQDYQLTAKLQKGKLNMYDSALS